MRHISLDDYLLSGPIEALDVITEITGAEKINLLGLCLGGTLTMATLAYLDAVGRDKINSATFLNTLIDFSEPGLLGVFTDEAMISRLERSMARTGFLPAAGHAPVLRPAAGQRPDLELRGQQLADGRGAAGLRPAQLERRLHPDARRHALVLSAQLLSGEPAGPRRDGARRPAARPVRGRPGPLLPGRRARSHRPVADLLPGRPAAGRPGPLRAVELRATSPASSTRPTPSRSTGCCPTTGPLPADADAWLAAATTRPATWWEDWASWIGDRAGALGQPPRMGSRKYRPLGDAPGRTCARS